ncbi:MAG: ATP-binding protein [Mycobacterium leprae]
MPRHGRGARDRPGHRGETGLAVSGDEPQLTTALGNLIENAVAYSPDGARVAVGKRRADVVEVSVTARGSASRSPTLSGSSSVLPRRPRAVPRDRGYRGGLAIVKHVVANHGGDVVWSVEGSGRRSPCGCRRRKPVADLPLRPRPRPRPRPPPPRIRLAREAIA